MTDVNTLNERTANQRIRDDFGALLIAVYRLPIEQRIVVLEQFEKNRRTAIAERLKPEEDVCEVCNGDGYIDIDGDAGDHGWDKIGEKACPVCYPPYEDPIQD